MLIQDHRQKHITIGKKITRNNKEIIHQKETNQNRQQQKQRPAPLPFEF